MNNLITNKKQTGMSLVELLISMVVGLFLLAGVVGNFISNKTADVKRDAVSEMDANAAEALRVLRGAIAHAGYRSIENTRLEDDTAFFTGTTNVANEACRGGINRDTSQVKANKRTRDGSNKDFLTVISLADNPLDSAGNPNPNALVYSDCTGGGATRDAQAVACSTDPNVGMPDPMQAKIYNSFWLRRNTSSSEDRTLYCSGNRSNAQPIVKDVESIQYLYGVKNATGGTTFRNATQVTNADQWPLVASVQVGLLMRSSNQFVLDEKSGKKTYYVLDRKVTIADSDLRRLFRIYTTTINLENQNEGELL